MLRLVSEVPLLEYKTMTACGLTTANPLNAQLAFEPRFQELNYHLGLFALGGRSQRTPDLEEADQRFRAAYSLASGLAESRARHRQRRDVRGGFPARIRVPTIARWRSRRTIPMRSSERFAR
ncbi:MAG: hypothetical protein QM736_01290 [Vicinamibacterales bacterium]